MGRWSKFKIPRALRKMQVGRQLGGLARSALMNVVPGAGVIHDLASMAGDPKKAKRVIKHAKKGRGPLAKKGGGFSLSKMMKGGRASAGRAAAMMGQLKKGNVLGAAFGEVSSLTGLGGGGHAGGGGRRRINVGNTKALRRSMRRVEGFAKLAKKTMSFVTHHKLKKTRRK